MKNRLLVTLLFVLGNTGLADGAMLRMQWRSLGPDDAEIELALHETAVIDIYFAMNLPEQTLARLSFENTELTHDLAQVATETLLPGWADSSIDGVLGTPGQLVDWAADPGAHVTAPGEYLIGSQTIRLELESFDRPLPITFSFDATHPIDDAGHAYTYAHDLHFALGYFGIGLGKPQTPGVFVVDWNPLYVITIPEPATVSLLAIGAVFVLRRRV